MPPFKAQFTGRFAYLYARDGSVRIVGPKMDGFNTHQATLSIQTRFVLAGEDHALRVVAVPGNPMSTVMTWDISGVDIEFADYITSAVARTLPAVTRNGSSGVPDLLDLADNIVSPRVNASLAAPQLDANVAVTTRITIRGGTLRPTGDDGISGRLVSFKRFSDRTPVASDDPGAVRIAEAMQWDAKTVEQSPGIAGPGRGLIITLRKFDRSLERRIVCRADSEVAIGFAHICNSVGGAERDEEFTAYYSLLQTAPELATQQIPVLLPPSSGFACTSTDDCKGYVVADV